MLKAVICILLILLGGTAGILLGRRYSARARQLEQCDGFLLRLKTYLGMERLTTRELFERAGSSDSFSELAFLKRTAEELSRDVNFPAVWRRCLEECRTGLALTAEDYAPLFTLCDLIGAYDALDQQNGIEVARGLLRERIADAQEKERKNGKLSRSLGLLAGIAAAILVF